MAFGPLCQSVLPKICIGRCPSPISCRLMHLDTFKYRFLTYGSMKLGLGPPVLPIAVEIHGLPTMKHVKFLRDYCNSIGSLEINLLSKSDITRNQRLPDIGFQLENLHTVVVTWGDGKSAQNYILHEFLRRVMLSKRIITVKYIYPQCSLTQYIPEAPTKITHLEVTGTCNSLLEIVLTPTPRLQSFLLNLNSVQGNRDIPILNHFLAITSHSLQNLQIEQTNGQFIYEVIRIPYLPKLKSMDMNIGVEWYPQKPMRTQIMECILSPKQRMCSKKTLRPKMSTAGLTLNWNTQNYILSCEDAAEWAIRNDCNYVTSLELPNLGNSANIEEVSLNNFPFRVASGLVPKIFFSVQSISRLTLNLRQSVAVCSFTTAHTDYLLEILTGLNQSDIPIDERRWPNLLTNKSNAITILKSKFPT